MSSYLSVLLLNKVQISFFSISFLLDNPILLQLSCFPYFFFYSMFFNTRSPIHHLFFETLISASKWDFPLPISIQFFCSPSNFCIFSFTKWSRRDEAFIIKIGIKWKWSYVCSCLHGYCIKIKAPTPLHSHS